MKMYRAVKIQFHTLFSAPEEGDDWSVSCKICFIHIIQGTPWVGGCVGPRTWLDAMEKRKIYFSTR
jgi:hypothetical protein